MRFFFFFFCQWCLPALHCHSINRYLAPIYESHLYGNLAALSSAYLSKSSFKNKHPCFLWHFSLISAVRPLMRHDSFKSSLSRGRYGVFFITRYSALNILISWYNSISHSNTLLVLASSWIATVCTTVNKNELINFNDLAYCFLNLSIIQ